MTQLSKFQLSCVGATLFTAAVYVLRYRDSSQEGNIGPKFSGVNKHSSDRVAVNLAFFRRLKRIIPIIIPGFFSKEFGYIVLVAITMVLRTYCDLWMIKYSTELESIIINRNSKAFPAGIIHFLAASVPIAVVNNVLKYGLEEMVLCFRTRLTDYMYAQYLKGFTYYKINNLDNRISNPDQLLTQDLEKFCRSLSDLYSNISKPLLDIVIYAYKLTGAIGFQGPFTMMLYLAVSGFMLTILRKPLGRYTVNEQRLEGEYRFINSRLITNSEEVAFYKGNNRESTNLLQSFGRLITHLRKAMRFRFSLGVFDHIIGKYVATCVGFWAVSRPFLDLNTPSLKNLSYSEIMESYYRSGRMLMNLAMAVGRLVLAGRELTRLAGFTARMTELIDVLKDLNSGIYKRTMVKETSQPNLTTKLTPNSGTIITQDNIILFDRVPLVTPNGDLLVPEITFEVQSGMNVLVCGPNGCGKSSLFRTLGELWPLFGGTLTKPSKEKLFYIPQRPYMTLGTLRDQVIYPHSEADLKQRGITDDDLMEFMREVQLDYIVLREGWDSVQDWMDVLSGGEKQRVAMARLFYHRPQFAILDECTSAVSVDVEGFIYTRCRELNITLFTVSHRKSLWKYHEYVLSFDGRGAYKFEDIHSATEFGS